MTFFAHPVRRFGLALLAAVALPLSLAADEGAYWETNAPVWANACTGALNLHLTFEDAFEDRAPLPLMAVQQRQPLQREVLYLGRDPVTGEYKSLVDKPCAQLGLLALLNRVPMQTEQNVRPSKRTVICLRAREDTPPAGELSAHLLCREGETCRADIGTDNVEVCPPDATQQGLRGFAVKRVPVTFDPHDAEAEPGWGVPSLTALETILKEERPGYTHFRIESQGSLAPATHATFGLRVNGTPIYIDYLPHFEVPVRVDPQGKLSLEFALPTLVFSGQEFGTETIEAQLRLYNGAQRLGDYRLTRTYRALRHAEPATVTPEVSGAAPAFHWTGKYVQPANIGKFEIFVFSSKNKDDAVKLRAAFERFGAEFDGKPVVGVIRPPLGKNTFYGLVLGLLRETGQIQFTFDETASRDMCRFALDMRDRPGGRRLIDKDVNRYEMEPRAPGVPRYRFCRDLVS